MNGVNRRRAALLLMASLAMMLSACAHTTVNKLMAEPQRWANRNVGLSGDVVESLSVLGHGAYRLDDGTGTIWVVSKHGVPRKGARVKVEGRVRDVVDLGRVIELPSQVGSGLVLLEDRHRAR